MTIIASVGENGELGRDGDLCWHIREDLIRFKQLTLGHPVIMGRKTWKSLPRRPLPGRLNIVISSHSLSSEGFLQAHSLEEALNLALIPTTQQPITPFIIGGASVYAQAMPLASRLEITRILASDPQADSFFPDIDPDVWKISYQSEVLVSASGLKFRYESYERRSAL